MHISERRCFKFKAVFQEVEWGTQPRRKWIGETNGILQKRKKEEKKKEAGEDEKWKGNSKTHRFSTGGEAK